MSQSAPFCTGHLVLGVGGLRSLPVLSHSYPLDLLDTYPEVTILNPAPLLPSCLPAQYLNAHLLFLALLSPTSFSPDPGLSVNKAPIVGTNWDVSCWAQFPVDADGKLLLSLHCLGRVVGLQKGREGVGISGHIPNVDTGMAWSI